MERRAATPAIPFFLVISVKNSPVNVALEQFGSNVQSVVAKAVEGILTVCTVMNVKKVRNKMSDEKKENAIIANKMQLNGKGIEPRTLMEAKLVAETFLGSDLVPKHFNSSSKFIVAVQFGLELGFSLWQSVQNLHVVNGQIGIKSSAIGGLIRSSGKCEWMEQIFSEDSETAIVKSKRVDDPTENESSFSIEDAEIAGLSGKDNWKKYPKDMLMYRALSRHGRHFYGDVMAGLYTTDELESMPTPEPSHETTTPKRKVESEQKDIEHNPITQELVLEVYEIFEKAYEKPTVKEFAKVCAEICGGVAEDYYYNDFEDDLLKSDVEYFTVEKLNELKRVFEATAKLKDKPKKKTKKKTTKKKAKEPLYRCVNNHEFEVPKPGHKGVAQCPECFTEKIGLIDDGKDVEAGKTQEAVR